jgi:hypothetical protein
MRYRNIQEYLERRIQFMYPRIDFKEPILVKEEEQNSDKNLCLFVISNFLKIVFLWDVMPCSLIHYCQRFGGRYCLHLQGRKVIYYLPTLYVQHIPPKHGNDLPD